MEMGVALLWYYVWHCLGLEQHTMDVNEFYLVEGIDCDICNCVFINGIVQMDDIFIVLVAL